MALIFLIYDFKQSGYKVVFDGLWSQVKLIFESTIQFYQQFTYRWYGP